jgi:O-antigen/teichoic acid export membrane protein
VFIASLVSLVLFILIGIPLVEKYGLYGIAGTLLLTRICSASTAMILLGVSLKNLSHTKNKTDDKYIERRIY